MLQAIRTWFRSAPAEPVGVPPCPESQLLALEPRILFDAAALVAGLDLLQTNQDADNQTIEHSNSWLVVDPAVTGWQSLLAGLDPAVHVVVLDPQQDGVAQLDAALAGQSNITDLHLLSHGAPGSFDLGSSRLSVQTLDHHAQSLQAWGRAMTADGDILIYGCDVGAGADGAALLETVARLTGADVAASTNQTGAAHWGGDWQLERASGPIEAANPLSDSARSAFDGLLTLPVAFSGVALSGSDADATNNYVDLPKADLLPAGSSGTFSLWFKIDKAPVAGDFGIIFSGATNPLNDLDLYIAENAGVWKFMVRATEVGTIAQDTWHHLAVAWDSAASTAKVYLDGNATPTNAAGINYAGWNSTVTLGAYTDHVSTFTFPGEIAGLRTWSGAVALDDTGWKSAPVGGSALNLLSYSVPQEDTNKTIALGGADLVDAPQPNTIGPITITSLPGKGSLWQTTDGITPTVQIVASNTDVTDSKGRVVFVPTANANGADSFSYKVKDANGEFSAVTTNSFTIAAVNDAPVMGTIRNMAVDLDGGNDYIRSALPTVFNNIPTQDITVEFDARVDDLNGYGTFTRLFEARFNNNNDFQFNVPVDGKVQVVVFDNGTRRGVSSTLAVPAAQWGQWHHYAATWTAATNTVRFFIDGVEQTGAETGNSATGSNSELRLGSRTDNQGRMNGALDEVRIWNVVRTPAEIAANRGIALTGSEAGLVNYWSFDEGAGVTSRDWASGGNTMTLTNMDPATDWIDSGLPVTENSTTNKLWVWEDGQRVIQLSGATDIDTPVASLQYRITTLPVSGKLYQYNAGVKGALIAANDLLTDSSGRLFWEPDADYFGSGTIQVKAWDGALNSLNTATLNLIVDPVNDAPVNTVPGAQTVVEDGSLSFSASVADVDLGAASLQLTLTAANGRVSLSQLTGLTFSSGDGVSDSTMTFTGTLASINAALSGALFVPTANYSGAASVTITSNDQGSSGAGGAQSDSDTIAITVTPVLDQPAVTNATTTENTQTGGGGALKITANAADGAEVAFFKITNITGGTLYLDDGVTPVSNGQFLTTAQVNPRLRFTPSPGLTTIGGGVFTFTVWASTVANDSGLSALSATATITVNPVNDPPVHTVPAAQTVLEDNPLVFSLGNGNELKVTDDASEDGSSVKTTLTVSKGKLTVAATSGASVVSNGTASVTITGTVGQINAELQGLIYQPNANYNGSDSLQIKTNDQGNTGAGGAKTTTDTVAITVSPLADTPTATAATTTEDVQTSAGLVLSRNGVDGVEVAFFKITDITGGTLYQNNGTTPINEADFISYAQGNAGLRFTPAANFTGSASFKVWAATAANDGGLGGWTTATITVNAVNDAPVNTVPLAQTLVEDNSLVFSTGNGTALQVTDLDVGAATLQVTLTASNGLLTLSQTTGLAFSVGDGTADASMTFTGTEANINAALEGTLFAPTANFSGLATVTLNTNDQGNTGAGGAKSDTDSVAITITPVADTPTVSNTTTNEDVQSSSGLVISRHGSDGAEVGFFKITNITGGTLYLSDGTTSIASGSFITVAQGNAGLRFTPAANQNSVVNGPFRFDVQASLSAVDLGLGGAVATAVITVNLVNDLPVLTASRATAFTEGDASIVVDDTVTVTDVDHAALTGATVSIGGYQSGADFLSFAAYSTITGSWDVATGLLTLSGAASLADYQAALRTVRYGNNSEAPTGGVRTIGFVGNDGVGNSVAATATITVIPVIDPPVVTAGATLNYTEGDAATVVDAGITVADLDDSNLEGAVVTISGGYYPAEDLLAFTNANGITGAWNGVTGTLTLSGTASLANYQTALRSITYANSGGDAPTAGSRTLSIQVNDGDVNSAVVTSTINVSAVNDRPVLTAGGVLTYTEGDGATVLDGTLTVLDGDHALLQGASVRFTGGFIAGQDQLNFTDANGISGNWDGGTGLLTLTGTASVANYQAALRSVSYRNLAGDNPTAGNRTLSYLASDGLADSLAVTSTVTVVAVNDLPVLTAGGLLNYTEGDGSRTVDATVTVLDLDNATLASATISLGAGFVAGEDLLTYGGGMAQAWDGVTGVLTLSGPATLADYQSALRSVTYTNTAGDKPTAGLRTLAYVVNDGTANSAVVTSQVVVTAVNDAPLLTAGGALLYTEGDGAAVLDSSITVTDADHSQLQRARVVISAGYVSGEDQLSFVNTGTISGSWDNTSGSLVLSLTGAATVADYQAALRSIKYDNIGGDNPTAGIRTVSLLVDDGVDESGVVFSTVTVVAINDAPTVTAGGLLTYVENSAASVIDNTITVNDPDHSQLQGATLTISGGYQPEDRLDFVDANGITGSWNGAGILTLTGGASLLDYQNALRSVSYTNTAGDAPTAGLRTLSLVLNDGTALSAAATATINVQAVNDAPVWTVPGVQVLQEDDSLPIAGISLADADVGGGNMQVAILVSDGTVQLGSTAGLTFSAGGDGQATMTFSGTLAAINAALNNLAYSGGPDSDVDDVLVLQVDDLGNSGSGGSQTRIATVALNVIAVNDPPVLVNNPGITVNEGQSGYVIDTVRLQATPLEQSAAQVKFTLGAIPLYGSLKKSGVTLAVGSSFTQDDIDNNRLTYSHAGSETLADSFRVAVTDGVGGSWPETLVSITITPVNDAPTLSLNTGVSLNEGASVTLGNNRLLVSDVDNTAAQIRYTLTQLPGNGLLKLGGVALNLNDTVTQANVDNSLLTYLHNGSETVADLFQFTVDDGAGGSIGTTSFVITVVAVNDTPVLVTNTGGSLNEAAALTIGSGLLAATDADNTAAQLTYQLTATPGHGQLTLNGTLLGVASSFSQDDVNNNRLLYTHDGGETVADLFRFTLADGAGGTVGESSFNLTIAAVNDAPVVTAGAVKSYTEGDPAVVLDGTLTVADVDNGVLQGATVSISGGFHAAEDLLSFTNSGPITGSWNGATGLLSLSGVATAAEYQAALRSILYSNSGGDNPSGGDRTFTFTVSDGAASSGAVTALLHVLPVNDKPVVTAGATLAYTENDGATVLDGTITLTDPDDSNLEGALVQLGTGYVAGQDRLGFSDGAGIIGVWDGGSGSLTLSGSASVAAYQAALRSITYLNLDGDTPTAGTRTVTFTVQDGALTSAAVTSHVVVTAVNDAPQLVAGGLLNYTENGAAQPIDGGIVVTDVDDSLLESATLTISSNYDTGKDRLAFTDTAAIVGSWDGATGRLTLLGTASKAAYQTALRSVTFVNSSDDPLAGDRTVQLVINDGALDSPLVTAVVRVTAVNDRPSVSGLAATSFTEGDLPVSVAAALLVTDLDNSQLQGAALSISSGYVDSQDRLLFTDNNGITGSWDGLTGVLTLNGAATVAQYQEALRSVYFTNMDPDNPSPGNRTLTLTVNDGTASSVAASMTLSVVAVNDAARLTLGGALAYTEGDGAAVVDAALLLSDPDDLQLTAATVEIAVGYQAGEDQLTAVGVGSITAAWDSTAGLLTLSGAGTVAQYQAVLRSISYQNNGGDNPTAGVRSLLYLVEDGHNSALAVQGSVVVTAVNDAPLMTAGAVLAYTEGDAAKVVDAGLTVTDADNAQLSSASVEFIAGYVVGQDQLAFSNGALITGSWDGASGRLTLTGLDTPAAYQAALARVTYVNNSVDTPTPGTRTLRFLVNDGTASSAAVTSSVVVTAVDDPPTLTAAGSMVYTEGGAAKVVDAGIVVADVDSALLQHASVTIRSGFHAGEDQLSFTAAGAIVGVWDGATGVLTLSGAASVADYQTALRSVSYVNLAGDNPSSDTRSLVFAVNDGVSESLEATASVQVVAVNDLPTVTSGVTLAYTEGAAASVVDATLTLTDPDSAQLQRATVTLGGALVSADEQLAATAVAGITVAWDSNSQTLLLTGSASVLDYQTVLRSVSYRHANDADPVGGNRTVSFVVNDGGGDSAVATATVTVTAVNDAPVITVPGAQSGTEDSNLIITGVSVADPDLGSSALLLSLTVNEGTVTVTPTHLTLVSGGNGQASVVYSGSLSDINAALSSILYRGDLNYAGNDTLSIQVSDQGATGSGGTRVDGRSIALTLAAVNDAPVANVDAIVTNEDTLILITVNADILNNDTDVDGDALTATILTYPDSGTLTDHLNGIWSYVPAGNVNGTITFTYTLSDGHGGTAIGNGNIIIHPVVDALVAENDPVAATLEDTPVTTGNVLVNDRDPDYHPGLPDSGLNPALAVIDFSQPAHGMAVYHGDGTFTYTPNADYYGTDSLVYTLGAGDARVDYGTVSFSITAVNDAPVLALNTGATVAEGGNLFVTNSLLKVTDVEQAATELRFTLAGLPSHGTLRNAGAVMTLGALFTQDEINNNRILYSHDGSESLADSFIFTVTDGAGATLFPASFALTVTPVNDAPVLVTNSGAALLEGATVTIANTLLRVTDADNSAAQLRFSLGSLPAYGTLLLNGVAMNSGESFTQVDLDSNRLSYRHGGSEQFLDGFDFTVTDGSGGGIGSSRFSFTMTNVNDTPVLATLLPLTVNEGGSGTITESRLSVTDAEQGAASLRYRLTLLPDYGTLRLNGAELALNSPLTQADIDAHLLTYVHGGSETLGDLFKFTVDDGVGGVIGESSFTVIIAPVNDLPVVTLSGGATTYVENGPAQILDGMLLISDVDNTTLQGATLSLLPGFYATEDQLSFTPVGGISGSWSAASGQLTLSGVGTLAEYQTALRSVRYQVSAAAWENPTAGDRSVRFVLHDGTNDSNTAIHVVTVVPVNDRPVAVAGGGLAYRENDLPTPVDATLTLTDPDDSHLEEAVIRISSGYVVAQDRLGFVDQWGIVGSWDGANGQLTLRGHATVAAYQAALRSVSYQNVDGDTPTAGTRTVSFVVSDGSLSSSSVSSLVQVTAVNDAPVIVAPAALSVGEDELLLVGSGLTLQDADVGSGLLRVSLMATHGVITLGSTDNLLFDAGANGSHLLSFTGSLPSIQRAWSGLHYQGDADYNGSDRLIVQVSDLGNSGSGAVGTAEAVIALTVEARQDAPVAGVDAFMTAEDAPLWISAAELLANDVDPDGDPLTATLSLQAVHGSLVDVGGGVVRYTPPQDYNGVDSFFYTVSDGHGGSSTAQVTLIVAPIEDALRVENDSLVMDEDGPALRFPVLANDRDPDNAGLLRVIGFTPTQHGRLIYRDDGTFSYRPDADFFGRDQFSYVANAGDARIGRGTVSIEVKPVNDLPVLQTQAELHLDQGRTAILNSSLLQAVDLEQGAAELVFTVASLPGSGYLTKNGQRIGVGATFTQADVDEQRVAYTHNGSTISRDAFKFTLADKVSPQWARVGTFRIVIRVASAVVIPEGLPKLVPDGVPRRAVEGVRTQSALSQSEVALYFSRSDRLSRHIALQESAPVLEAVRLLKHSVGLEESGTPLLTAVSNSNPGVQDGGLVTPVLTAVQQSVVSVAPGGLKTPVLTAVMAENSQALSPVLGTPSLMTGFALQSGWFFFGPEFDLPFDEPFHLDGLPNQRPVRPLGGEGAVEPVPEEPGEPLAVVPDDTAVELQQAQGLYAQIRQRDQYRLAEAAALLAAFS